MARLKDQEWNLPAGTPQADGSRTHNYDTINAALLMDIRDEIKANTAELQRLNALMHCHNTITIPNILRKIEKRLAKAIPLK